MFAESCTSWRVLFAFTVMTFEILLPKESVATAVTVFGPIVRGILLAIQLFPDISAMIPLTAIPTSPVLELTVPLTIIFGLFIVSPSEGEVIATSRVGLTAKGKTLLSPPPGPGLIILTG